MTRRHSTVGPSCEAVELRECGAGISLGPIEAPHDNGMTFKNLYVRDPDGYTIVFGCGAVVTDRHRYVSRRSSTSNGPRFPARAMSAAMTTPMAQVSNAMPEAATSSTLPPSPNAKGAKTRLKTTDW